MCFGLFIMFMAQINFWPRSPLHSTLILTCFYSDLRFESRCSFFLFRGKAQGNMGMATFIIAESSIHYVHAGIVRQYCTLIDINFTLVKISFYDLQKLNYSRETKR